MKKEEIKKLKVGLVMPIAAIDGLGTDHWLEVKKIIIDALDEDGSFEFETKIVSESESVGLIHKRIVQGLYTSDIVICDVSCKNPNVMFELGMRLAFDKPTVIIIDDKTNFTFDAGVIEHLSYPRDLRFSKIIEFKQNLAHKVIATYRDSQNDPEHSPFLKSYGPFTSVKIEPTEISSDAKILELLSELQTDVQRLRQPVNKRNYYASPLNTTGEVRNFIFSFLDGASDGLTNKELRYAQDAMFEALIEQPELSETPVELIKEFIKSYIDKRINLSGKTS